MCLIIFSVICVDLLCLLVVFSCFCFKQKTAYEMRISDWSSDVWSSDLAAMIYAGVNIQFRKPGGDMIGPTLAPFLDKFGAVPVAFLRAKTLFVHRAHG